MVYLSKSAVPTGIDYSVRLSHNPDISIGGAHYYGYRLYLCTLAETSMMTMI